MIESLRKIVRPVVTLALVATAIYGFVTKLIAVDVFVPMVTMVLSFWFVERAKKKEG